ncbi:hypothetical protein U472_09735 [Orenia metallireducens]|uniref:Uncharacterized protein n=1 Tax=Orenia metallireducens TaxID=1413210 RepID=A0A1C0A7S0_9FIRM|nr:hypothetical protein [Orenia metallireducens]OCL26282.1 hypothetical protein U472_09735 [Orenia metallireducens]
MNIFKEIIKMFLEKQFIRTLIATAGTFIIYIILPNDYYLIMKLGILGFYIFVFILAFLLIVLIEKVIEFFKKNSLKRANKIYQRKEKERNIKVRLEQIWSYVDGLSNDDFLLLQKFIENGNKPIEKNANTHYSSNSLLSSQYVHNTIVAPPKNEIKNGDGNMNYKELFMKANSSGKKLYVLEDSFYQLLKYSKEKYGRISHFR